MKLVWSLLFPQVAILNMLSKNVFEISYMYKGKDYKIILWGKEAMSGPEDCISFSDEQGTNMDDVVLRYLGPRGDYYKDIPFLTPGFLKVKKVIMTKGIRDVCFEGLEPIDITK